MRKHLFWLNWEQPFKHLASFLFIVLLVLITLSIALIGIGAEGLIGWHTFSQKVAVDAISQHVAVGPFNFPFSEQLLVIKEFVSGGELPNTLLAKQISIILILSLLGLVLTVLTYFNRWGFLGFSALIFMFIVFMHPEMLQLINTGDTWILAIIFFWFAAPAYYFHAFKDDASFGVRLISMLGVVSVFILIVLFQSKVDAPLNALFSYGLLAPYLIVLLFIVAVAHEIVNGFALAIAGSKDEPDNKRIYHFLVITFIYLVNVLISYLEITHVIHWNFITINPIILLAIAAILGVWGISKRYVLYKTVSAFQQIWVLLYLALAAMAFTTIAYLLFSLEDPMLKIIGDFTIYSQLAFGIAFMLYIIYNFSSIIEQGHGLSDILYKPQNLPHVTYRLVGVVMLTAFVLMRDIKYPIWYSLGGYYNSIAGYFEDQKEDDLKVVFYEKGADLSKSNHKSNYKLGMHFIDAEPDLAIDYFENASSRIPSPQAFVNKANLESDNGKYFESLFSLESGVKEYPNSTQIQNNLGLQFQKAQMLDSAWHYFSQSKQSAIAKNNALIFVLKNNFEIAKEDSSFLFDELNTVGTVNAAALGLMPASLDDLNGDNMISGSLLNNALVNGLIPYSPSNYKHIRAVVDSTKNPVFSEELNFALAIYELKNERVNDALLRLERLGALGSDKQSTYYETMGLINLQYESFNEAERFFLLAIDSKQPLIPRSFLPQLALAQSEAGYFDDAINTWEKIAEELNQDDSLKATIMVQVLSSIINSNDSILGDDISLYLKARYQRVWVDEYSVKATTDRITSVAVKNQLALELAEYYFDAGNDGATKMFYDLIDAEKDNGEIFESLLQFNVRMAYAGLIPDLNKHLTNYYNQGFDFNESQRLEKAFFGTNRAEIPLEQARELAVQNPYFAEGIVWAADYFKDDEDEYRSYNILQEAMDKNPDSRIILEAYMIEAVDKGFSQYANTALQHYRELFPGDQFYRFQQTLLQHEARFEDWEEQDSE